VAREVGSPIPHLRGFASILPLEYPTIAKSDKYSTFPGARIQNSSVAPHYASERQSLAKIYVWGAVCLAGWC
jgi:hypothetical protein